MPGYEERYPSGENFSCAVVRYRETVIRGRYSAGLQRLSGVTGEHKLFLQIALHRSAGNNYVDDSTV
jgi:hypothetical protein